MADKMITTSMDLPEQSVATLRELARRTGTTPAEVVRRAVATEKFLRDTAAEGSKILIRKQDSTYRELIIP